MSSQPAAEIQTSSAPPRPRTAVIAGGGGPIGFAVLQRLCALGMHVGVLGSSQAKAEATVQRLGDAAGLCLPLGCDVADSSAVRAALAAVAERWGGVDVVVALQGRPPRRQSLTAVCDDEWDAVLRSHLTGSFRLLQQALPWLGQSAAPRVIFFASFGPEPHEDEVGLPYAVAKDAIIALTYRAARSVAEQGITVNCIAAWGLHNADAPDDATPCGALDEVAAAVCTLAAEDAGAITGAVLNIRCAPTE